MTYESPSVEVYRSVLNVGEQTMASLGNIAAKHGITAGMKLVPASVLRSTLLSRHEVSSAANDAGAVLTDKSAIELADYINGCLPESADEDFITISALPLIAYRPHEQNKHRKYRLGLGAWNPVLAAEQWAARQAAAEWLKLPSRHTMWGPPTNLSVVGVASGNRGAIERLLNACSASDDIKGMALKLQYPAVEWSRASE